MFDKSDSDFPPPNFKIPFRVHSRLIFNLERKIEDLTHRYEHDHALLKLRMDQIQAVISNLHKPSMN